MTTGKKHPLLVYRARFRRNLGLFFFAALAVLALFGAIRLLPAETWANVPWVRQIDWVLLIVGLLLLIIAIVRFIATRVPYVQCSDRNIKIRAPLYQVVFSYSDISHEQLMHTASLVLACGADFRLMGPDATMLASRRPVVSVCAVRTGCGKSQVVRYFCDILVEQGIRPVVVRHPMPYGDLATQAVERLATDADLDRFHCTIEEREEYEHLLAHGAQRVDVGLCNETPFLLWAGIGLDAIAIHKLEPRPRFAKYISVPHFFATTVWEATFWDGMDLSIWADGREVEGHFLLAVATNIRRYVGGIAVLSPRALLDDGEMDLWLFSGKHLADAFRHFFDMLAGRHLTSSQARCLPFRSARVESRAPFSVQMDGEPMLGSVKAELTIRPRALRVLMPLHALGLLKDPVTL